MVGEEAHLRDSVKSEKMMTNLTRSGQESEGQALTSVMVRKQKRQELQLLMLGEQRRVSQPSTGERQPKSRAEQLLG